MPANPTRRSFLSSLMAAPLTVSASAVRARTSEARIKLSCNLYSFNTLMREGEMTLEEVIDLCADMGFHAVDPTGYYFPGYPEPPDPAYVHAIKKRAFLQGLDISGTGVRNDFAVPDIEERKAAVKLVKRWIHVAALMDAPILRVFATTSSYRQPEGVSVSKVHDWVIECLRECTAYGQEHGVLIGLQNHNDLLKTADESLHILDGVDSDWLGIYLDIGSLRQGDPYKEIALLAPYAYSWQIKEYVYRDEVKERVDVQKIVEILRDVGYRGYIPLETLRPADPRTALPPFLKEIQHALAS